MHMQSRSVDLDLPRARGALPRDPGLPYALALPVGVACRGCVCVWLRVWHFQRTTRAQTYLTNQSVHRTVRLTPNLHDTTHDDDGAREERQRARGDGAGMEEKKGAPRPPAERPVSCGAHHHASIRISITPRTTLARFASV